MTSMARRLSYDSHYGSEMSSTFEEECPVRKCCPGTLITKMMSKLRPGNVTHILLGSPASQAELYRQCPPSSNDSFQ